MVVALFEGGGDGPDPIEARITPLEQLAPE
jgi:hypothetical protein